MATKQIVTRIKNKVDSLSAWNSYTGTLLDGEIAIVRVETNQTYTNPITNKTEPVVELLMKVGDGSTPFGTLPWLSAKASDVFGWAKVQDPSTITVQYNNGTADKPDWRSSTLANILKDLETAEAAIASVKAGFSVEPATATANGVVQGVTYDSATGKFTVSYGTVAAKDIASNAVTTDKIANSNVTTAKIADLNVTDAKIATVSASKVEVTPKTTVDGKEVAAVMLPAKLEDINAEFLRIEGKLDNFTASGVRFIGKVKAAPSANSNAVTIDDGSTNGKSATAKLGDIVLYNNIEHICIATTGDTRWQVLGDQSQIGTLTTLTGSLHASARTANKYVTHIKKDANGKLQVQYAQPTVNEVLAATSEDADKTLAEKLSDVDAAIASKSDSGHTHSSYVNQNAFSNIKVSKSGGGTSDVTVAADTATDTVVFEGSNVTITGTNGSGSTADKITFAVAAGTTSAKGIVQLNDATEIASGKTGSETAATTKAVASAMDAAEAADAKAAQALAAAGHSHPYASSSHTHGNITNGGTITTTALTNTSGVAGVVVTDSSNKVTRMAPATVRSLIGAGTSSLAIGTTATTAAAGNHTHSTYEGGISDLQSKTAHISTVSVTINGTATTKNVLRNGNATDADILIFDCGGAWEI